jgi:hypothetical protein
VFSLCVGNFRRLHRIMSTSAPRATQRRTLDDTLWVKLATRAFGLTGRGTPCFYRGRFWADCFVVMKTIGCLMRSNLKPEPRNRKHASRQFKETR